MDDIRYFAALLAVVVYPPAVFFWILVHPLTGFWRRIGLVLSYIIILSFLVGIAIWIYHFRDVTLAVDFGTNWLLISLAAILFGAGMVIEIRCFQRSPDAIGIGERGLHSWQMARNGNGVRRKFQLGGLDHAFRHAIRPLCGCLAVGAKDRKERQLQKK